MEVLTPKPLLPTPLVWSIVTLIEPDMWPQSSPDLNPVDYAILRALQHKRYSLRKVATIEHLNVVIEEEG